MISHAERLRGLVDAGIALASELSLPVVLERLLETARTLTGARYAALGVIDRSGTGLQDFLTSGIDEETKAVIGTPPTGRGILGVLIRDRRPLRLHDLAQDPRSVGFPPGHPPMQAFLGVPIQLRGIAYGTLYLTEKDGGSDFTDDDEEVVGILAAQAAVAIENARLYESATRWLRQLESLTEITSALATETDLHRILNLVAERLRELVGARLVVIHQPTADGELRIDASSGHAPDRSPLGLRHRRGGSKSGRLLERRWPERVDSFLDDPEVDRELLLQLVETAGIPYPTAGIFVPLVVRDKALGVVVVLDKVGGEAHTGLRFTEEDVRLAEALASKAAIAIDLSQRIQRDALGRAVAAQELERKRLARELHDETGQALTSILLGLRAIEEAPTAEDRSAAGQALREIVVTTLHDVRRLAVELRPKALDDFGLVPALERLVSELSERTGLRIELHATLPERPPSEIEVVLYRIVQEALTNIVKHARARRVSIVVAGAKDTAKVAVEDDGRGFDAELSTESSLGLLGMRERIGLVGGSLTVESSSGAGTTIVAEVPLP